MKLSFFQNQLKPGVKPSEVFSWASYDFANSGYSTVVLTAIFNAYFVGVVTNNESWSTLAWTLVITLSNLISIGVIPLISARADKNANKKQWLCLVTLICVTSTGALGWSQSGDFLWASIFVILSNIAFNAGVVLNSAFLSELALPKSFGRISGWGWSFGYLGGIVCLGLCLMMVEAQKHEGAEVYVGSCMLITALIFLLGSLPMFFCVRERSKPLVVQEKHPFEELKDTVREVIKENKNFAWLCLSGVFYQAGIAVVVTLSAVYAQIVMKFSTAETILLILIVNFTAAFGAFALGFLHDIIGHKKNLILTILIWILTVVLAGFSESKTMFWVSANFAGIAMGSSQSSGRAMVASLVSKNKLAQFYSLWNVAVWVANVLGPITYGVITWMTGGNHRMAILVTGLFFVMGLLALWPIKLQEQKKIPSH